MTEEQEQEAFRRLTEEQEAEAALSVAMVDQGYFSLEEDYPRQNLRLASKLLRSLRNAGFEIKRLKV